MVNEEKASFELIEVEDIVPVGANSLFLCVARTLIYLSCKTPNLAGALKARLKIDPELLKSDVALQYQLRTKLCEYFLEKGVHFDENKKNFHLNYSKFNGNVYDFLIQVYQMSINNYGSNQLFQRHAIFALSRLLGVNIYCLKLDGTWRYAEHKQTDASPDAKLLGSHTIYLRELRFSNQTGRNYRMLLPKNLWLTNRAENMNIALRFSQFSDRDIFRDYQKKYFTMSVNEILKIVMKGVDLLNVNGAQRAFCVLLDKINMEQLIKADDVSSTDDAANRSFTSSTELTDTLAKMIENSSSHDLGPLYTFFDSLIQKPGYFSNSSVEQTFQKLISSLKDRRL